MIGRLLASAAFAVALSGTAMAQMAPPPPANPGPSGEMNSGPGKASPGELNGGHTLNNTTNTTTDSTSAGQAGAGQGTRGPRALNAQPDGNRSSTAGSTMSNDRQTAQGQRGRDSVADKLNACEAKPLRERQACFDEATRM